jgi:hypothetical protein
MTLSEAFNTLSDRRAGPPSARSGEAFRASDIETASQDAAWRIIVASDMLRDRLSAFEARGDDQRSRLDRLEQAFEAQRADRGLLTGMAQGLQASFDGILDALQDIGKRMDGLAAPDDTGFGKLAEGLMAAAERAQRDREAVIEKFEKLDETHLATAMRQALADPLRAIAGDLASIEGRLANLESVRPLKDISTAPLPVPSAPMEAERSMVHRMVAGFGMLMQRLNDQLGTLEASAARLAQVNDLPDLTHWKTISGQLEFQTDRLAAMEQTIGAMARKGEQPPPGFAQERSQLQQVLVGFRMIAQEMSDAAGRIATAEAKPVVETVDLSALAAPLHASIETMQGAVAEMVSAAEMRLASAAPVPSEPAKHLEPREALTERALAATEAAARRMQTARLAIAEDFALLRAVLPKADEASLSPALQRMTEEMQAASADFDRRIGDFLSLSAALSHEMSGLQPAARAQPRQARIRRK